MAYKKESTKGLFLYERMGHMLRFIINNTFNNSLTAADPSPLITWPMLKEMNYETGNMPDNIKNLMGKPFELEDLLCL